jgi:hypothetical protein
MHSQISASDPHARTNLNIFPFSTREIGPNGKSVPNKCGRDFLMYACAHLRPEETASLGLKRFERSIGIPMPPSFVWTGLPFLELVHFLRTMNLELSINGVTCRSRSQLWKALWWPAKISHTKALSIASNALSRDRAVGIDVSMRFNGIANHVMYVWAIRSDDMIVFDTHKVPGLEYEHLFHDADGYPTDPDQFIMRLPHTVIENRWRRWSRVWVIQEKSIPKT